MKRNWRAEVRWLLLVGGAWCVTAASAPAQVGKVLSPREVRGPLSMVLPELAQQEQGRGGRAGRTSASSVRVAPLSTVQQDTGRSVLLSPVPTPLEGPGGPSGYSDRAHGQLSATARAVAVDQSALIRPARRRRIRDYSWIYIDPPQQREIKVHDIITIIVDEKAEVTVQSRYRRDRNANLKAQLREFVRIGETGNLTNAAENSPTIDATLQGRLNSTGQMSDQEGVRYRIAATVVDVLPNGNLVLEARKSIRTTQGLWEYRLTGEIRAEDVGPDNTAYSENIANLKIEKTQKGKIFGSTQRPWGVWLYDLLSPF